MLRGSPGCGGGGICMSMRDFGGGGDVIRDFFMHLVYAVVLRDCSLTVALSPLSPLFSLFSMSF